ncbi:MAG: hypothetical protein L3K07_08975 [Thermoplasmata archaeon]|nr:hypothetical protein [Thermoplasmata archaeon]
MDVPGPGGLLWGLELLAFAGLCLPLGELLRRLAAPYVGLFRSSSPVERGLLDLYLAGGAFYLFGWLPIESGLLSVALLAAGVALLFALRAYRGPASGVPPLSARELASPSVLLLVGITLALFALELGAAEGAPTGNTFDSGILASFVGLTNLHHQLPTSFLPVAAQGIAYPQGTTAWLLPVQWLFGLPPARAPLLLTPLFLALSPVAAYVWGERWWGNRRAAVALALVVALLASWTRLLASGSNDFALAFPLVLLLWAWTPRWVAAQPPGVADAVGFGAVAGYAAALNPTGPELWFLLAPVLLLLIKGVRWSTWRPWLGRWATALGVGLLFVLPSVAVLWAGRSNSNLLPGAAPAPPGSAVGLTSGQVVGYLDPLLFGRSDVWLSPFPLLRAELAALLVVGVVLLYLLRRDRASQGNALLAGFAPAALAATALLLLLDRRGAPSAALVGDITSAGEASMLLFTIYAALAAVPLIELLDWLAKRTAPESDAPSNGGRGAPEALPPPRHHGRLDTRDGTAVFGVAVLAILLLPGVVVTTTDAPGYLHGIYLSFGNTTQADFALLDWADTNLPHGARVLVAPGSAGQFLPGYRADIALLFPEIPVAGNLSYSLLVSELDAGTLDGSGHAALSALAVEYVVVTGRNTQLWPPFSPEPLLADPAEFPVYFATGDAYLFGVSSASSAAV